MMNFLQFGEELCGGEVPHFLGIFDLSTAHPMLFYSYIPIVIAASALGLYIYRHNNESVAARLFAFMTAAFVAWTVNILVQWVASYHRILMFSWQLTAIFEILLYVFALLFAYTFLLKKTIDSYTASVLSLLVSVVIVLTPTTLNISGYDLYNCEGISGVMWDFIYMLETALIIGIVFIAFDAYRRASAIDKPQVGLVGLGMTFFLSIFFISNLYGEITRVYEFNLWGPFGMLLLLGLTSYSMVKYHSFQAKLFATQALVGAIGVLILALLFLDADILHRGITLLTLITFAISGHFLIQSVKREILLREQLEVANQQQESLLHFISHEVKGYLTKGQNAFAGIVEKDYGEPTEQINAVAKTALIEMRKGVATVMDILDASNLKKGTVSYKKTSFDIVASVHATCDEMMLVAEEKALTLERDTDTEPIIIEGDEAKIRHHVIRNLIDNAIRYTQQGTISVSVKKKGKVARFEVVDTGVGIDRDDMARLFTEGGHGKDSIHYNVDSTGYGLFVAKEVVTGHGGKIWAESKGKGSGSTFIAEFPLA